MKNRVFQIFLTSILVLIGCQRHVDTMFKPCQSFDEFCMTELYADSVVEPFLYVKRTLDTIRIVRSDQFKDTMIYLNKGSYWYSSIRIHYDYSLCGYINRKFSPMACEDDPQQIDIYRYITENLIIEAFFHCDGKCNVDEMGKFPDYINIYSRNSRWSYTFFDDLDNIIDSISLGQTTIWQVYQKHKHTLKKDSYYFDYKMYRYDTLRNTMYIESSNVVGDIIVDDSIQLDAIGPYHVPTYQFDIDNGKYYDGIYDDKMRIRIKCTTLETDRQ